MTANTYLYNVLHRAITAIRGAGKLDLSVLGERKQAKLMEDHILQAAIAVLAQRGARATSDIHNHTIYDHQVDANPAIKAIKTAMQAYNTNIAD